MRPRGIEPLAFPLGGGRSILLSYGRIVLIIIIVNAGYREPDDSSSSQNKYFAVFAVDISAVNFIMPLFPGA